MEDTVFKKNNVVLKREGNNFVVNDINEMAEKMLDDYKVIIRIIKKEDGKKGMRKFFSPPFFYSVKIFHGENEYQFDSTIFEMKKFLHFLEIDKVNMYDADRRFPVFTLKRKKKLENDFTIDEKVKKWVTVGEINSNDFYQMRVVRIEEEGVSMLLNAREREVIDILGIVSGYSYLKELMKNKNSEILKGKPITFEVVGFLFSIPLFTLFFRIMASVLSTGPVSRGYNTSLYFFLLLVAISSAIMLNSFLVGERASMYTYVISGDKIVWKNIWLKYLLVFCSFIFTLALCYLLTIPLFLLLYLFGFVSILLFLPVALYIIYFWIKLR